MLILLSIVSVLLIYAAVSRFSFLGGGVTAPSDFSFLVPRFSFLVSRWRCDRAFIRSFFRRASTSWRTNRSAKARVNVIRRFCCAAGCRLGRGRGSASRPADVALAAVAADPTGARRRRRRRPLQPRLQGHLQDGGRGGV